jgi:peptidoglycan/xylan/chitin deacetylase (PgdA/CDA1 family)
MYHYVRDLRRSRYPGIKGLTLEGFRGQLDHLATRHAFVRVEDLLAGADLPERAVLLTFDDGYADHYRYVFPILNERGIAGCFFPPVRPLRERVVLDVNKIHFALASGEPAARLAEYCLRRVDELRDEYDLAPRERYLETYRKPTRLDDAETVFVKRLLQRGLPAAARARIADELFRRFVTADETAFAEELYLTPDQVRTMRRAGMYFGAHGMTHRWLDSLTEPEQREEILGSRAWLGELGYGAGEWVIAYPYGGFTDATLAIAREAGYALGFTTEDRVAEPGRDDPLRIPRIDTVDLPQRAEAPPPARGE